MKASRLVVCLLACLMLLMVLPLYWVNGQNYYTYTVHIHSDGSAYWKITYFSGSNDAVDTWDGFETKVSNLAEASSSLTHRGMGLDSLEINTTVLSASSKITEYSFHWQNFSIAQGNQIVFGDVFGVKDFFTQLYGDGQIQISYPPNFTVKSALPAPYEQDDAAQTLSWLEPKTFRIIQ